MVLSSGDNLTVVLWVIICGGGGGGGTNEGVECDGSKAKGRVLVKGENRQRCSRWLVWGGGG